MIECEFNAKEFIKESIRTLVRRDGFLLQCDVHERAIAHRLAVYIERDKWITRNGYQVDCEYNKISDNLKKTLHGMGIECNEDEGGLVYPDIIIHKRGRAPKGKSDPDQPNLMIIEIKKSTSKISCNYDVDKVKAYMDQLHYVNGIALQIFTGPAYGKGGDNFKIEYESLGK